MRRDEGETMKAEGGKRFKPYPAYKDSGVEWLGEIPEGWGVRPHIPNAWIAKGRRDTKDGEVGIVGYEINFNRYFYRYTPPRPLEEIEADIRAIGQDIMRMPAEVTATDVGD